MRGRGADPNRVVDYARFAGQFGNQFSSQQPGTPADPMSAAPQSPRVGTGAVAQAQSTWGTSVESNLPAERTSAINVQPSTPQMGILTGEQGAAPKVPGLDTTS